MKTVAERVKWAREKRGHSCAGLDELAELSCGHVAKIERGTPEDPSSVTITKIADALGVTPQWLMFGGSRPHLGKSG